VRRAGAIGFGFHLVSAVQRAELLPVEAGRIRRADRPAEVARQAVLRCTACAVQARRIDTLTHPRSCRF